MVALRKFQTLVDLLLYFKDEQTCRDYLELIRWNGKIVCPYKECKHDHVFKYTDGKRYKCAKCQRQFSVKVGTIFEDSKITLQKWFAAIYLITSHKKGISSLQLHRDLGVTQKTAWFMLHRVRHTLLVSPSEKLTGIIEADETFIGGKEANKHKSKQTANTQGRSSKTKTPVLGIIERGGQLRAIKILNTKGYSIRPFIVKNVEFGSTVHTDEWWGYRGLARIFKHQYINHGQGEYAKDGVHTNSIEGFFSQFKRMIYGIYHQVTPKHLGRYCDEMAFRYNSRKIKDPLRFTLSLKQTEGRLTWNQLTAKKPLSLVSDKL